MVKCLVSNHFVCVFRFLLTLSFFPNRLVFLFRFFYFFENHFLNLKYSKNFLRVTIELLSSLSTLSTLSFVSFVDWAKSLCGGQSEMLIEGESETIVVGESLTSDPKLTTEWSALIRDGNKEKFIGNNFELSKPICQKNELAWLLQL